jgi:hypothetical protein
MADGEHAAEDVDEEDGDAGHDGLVAGVVQVPRAGAGDDGEAHGHGECAAEEHRAPAPDVVQAGAGTGEDPAGESVESVQEKLGVGVGDADVRYEERKDSSETGQTCFIVRVGLLLWSGSSFTPAWLKIDCPFVFERLWIA